ncbi:MAG: NADP(H)-dependent aldo-keto reductase [Alphaproteobacteria bacterium]|nr:NADP(H)-dependent aldo-keto reductase [Alphaproteobacteria bacterium]
MELRPLGRTGIKVSRICLGTMTWGQQNSESEAHAQLDMALDRGINFIDTAEMYPVPPMAETQGRTESYIGSWFAARRNRERVILASKVSGRGGARGIAIRGGETRLDRAQIRAAVEGSLQRLRTDYIDLYQTHWPDRKVNAFGQLGFEHDPADDAVPLLETLEAMADLVREGKVRAIGLSNETPWGLMECLRLSERHGLPRIAAIQNPYNLLNRSFEIGLAEIAHREDVGLLAYSPLAMGVLSGKYQTKPWPAGARLTLFERFQRYTRPEAAEPTAAYIELARRHSLAPDAMALAFVNGRSFLTANIIGATSTAQLARNIDSLKLTLPGEVLAGIEAIHRRWPNVCP